MNRLMPAIGVLTLLVALGATVTMLAKLGVPAVGVQWQGTEAGEQRSLPSDVPHGPAVGPERFVLEPAELAAPAWPLATAVGRSRLVDELLRERGSELSRPAVRAKVAMDGSGLESALVLALGHEPVDVGPDPLPDRFALSAELRAQAAARLRRAEALGAAALLVSGPRALARWALLTRRGTWSTSRVVPVLGVELARLALAELPLGRRALEASPTRGALAAEVLP